ncbi:hypothetical protein B5F76_06320 [Desulfovibrio sp. An276]|nr:hypothetical protein B5F76_06320 [Desulfovibrio sp. An276]
MFDKSWTNRTGEEREIIPGNLHDDTNAPFQNLYHFGCILCDTERKKKKETDFFYRISRKLLDYKRSLMLMTRYVSIS